MRRYPLILVISNSRTTHTFETIFDLPAYLPFTLYYLPDSQTVIIWQQSLSYTSYHQLEATMTTKRPAGEASPGVPPPTKLHRSNSTTETALFGCLMGEIVAPAMGDSLITAAKEAVVQAPNYGNRLSNIIDGLIMKVEVEELNVRKLRNEKDILQEEVSESRVRQEQAEGRSSAHLVKLANKETQLARMRAKVTDLKDEAKTFKNRTGFEAKLKELKIDHGKKMQEIRAQNDSAWKRKVGEFQDKYKVVLSAKEEDKKKQITELKQSHKIEIQGLKLGFKEDSKRKLEEWKEVQKAKEVAWKNEISELRANHKEQLAKKRADVKMVEAAQKVVQLNAQRTAGGNDVVKTE